MGIFKFIDSDEKYFKDVCFIVEATSTERFLLWKEFNSTIKWNHVMKGHGIQIGELNNRPITIDISYAILNGKKVMFYSGCSMLVDHKMLNDWIEHYSSHLTYDNGRWAQCDAMNFATCISFIKEMTFRGL